ncbi:hypothetical protein MA16_Dca019257 [Dendrobium catenatum]|uniref:Uncharacterized protein n=1 Tax=Dendrobium catenatum TaxID=906689 RepID=A0A2I0WBM0_9ASPA|nr:hypothetical protein MA16_Dca019257 [Dendrobium catenatum]
MVHYFALGFSGAFEKLSHHVVYPPSSLLHPALPEALTSFDGCSGPPLHLRFVRTKLDRPGRSVQAGKQFWLHGSSGRNLYRLDENFPEDQSPGTFMKFVWTKFVQSHFVPGRKSVPKQIPKPDPGLSACLAVAARCGRDPSRCPKKMKASGDGPTKARASCGGPEKARASDDGPIKARASGWSGKGERLRWWSGEGEGLKRWSGEGEGSGGGPAKARASGGGPARMRALGGSPARMRASEKAKNLDDLWAEVFSLELPKKPSKTLEGNKLLVSALRLVFPLYSGLLAFGRSLLLMEKGPSKSVPDTWGVPPSTTAASMKAINQEHDNKDDSEYEQSSKSVEDKLDVMEEEEIGSIDICIPLDGVKDFSINSMPFPNNKANTLEEDFILQSKKKGKNKKLGISGSDWLFCYLACSRFIYENFDWFVGINLVIILFSLLKLLSFREAKVIWIGNDGNDVLYECIRAGLFCRFLELRARFLHDMFVVGRVVLKLEVLIISGGLVSGVCSFWLILSLTSRLSVYWMVLRLCGISAYGAGKVSDIVDAGKSVGESPIFEPEPLWPLISFVAFSHIAAVLLVALRRSS